MHGLRIVNKDGQELTQEEITAANKVATTFKSAKVGAFKVTDPVDEIEVDYYAHKALAVTQGGQSVYFGCYNTVEIRCKCRGVVLAETKAGARISADVGLNTSLPRTDTGVDSDPRTATYYESAYYSDGVVESYQVTNSAGSTADVYKTFLVVNNTDAQENKNYIIYPIIGGGGKLSNYVTIPPNSVCMITAIAGANSPTATCTLSVLSDRMAAINAANAAAANQRSAVFLTDGTELVSANIDKILIRPFPSPFYAEANSMPYKTWLGGSQIPLYLKTINDDNQIIYIRAGLMTAEIPDDVCAPVTGFLYHAGDDNQSVYLITTYDYYDDIPPFLISKVEYDGFYSYQYRRAEFLANNIMLTYGVVDVGLQTATLIDIVENQIKTGIERENKRRKKCSDAQMAYLRNGFLPPEFEYFIKNNHPVSELVKREIPMEVIGGPTYTQLNDPGLVFPRVTRYEGSVTLKYVTNDSKGNQVPHIETFTGSATVTESLQYDSVTGAPSTGTWHEYSYTNFPMLSSQSPESGSISYPNTNALGSAVSFLVNDPPPLMSGLITLDADESKRSELLFSLLNGGWIANRLWNPTGRWFDGTGTYPVYTPGFTSPPTSATLKYTQPQFLLDYIAASKPIETEIDESGNKVPVTPSVNWLSSSIADKEIIKVIPLHHVGNSYGNYGMFPFYLSAYENTLVVNKLCIYGYAEVQYNSSNGSFTFKKWVELIDDGKLTILPDDEVLLDDDLNPTTISVTSNGETNTYNLTPVSFDYDEGWGATNCVCIGNKAIWTDVKSDAKEQKKNISDAPPEGYELTAEERLYKAVREAIT